jgi:hypothetical protein
VRIARSYTVAATVVAMVSAGCLSYALGARRDLLFPATAIGTLPVRLALMMISCQLFPPELVVTGEFRSVLYRSDTEAITPPTSRRPLPTCRPYFVRVYVNVILVVAFIGCLLVGGGLIRLHRALNTMLPWLATSTGPRTFPVTIRMRDDGIEFTNGSTGAWICRSRIGTKFQSALFSLAAGETKAITYGAFEGGGTPLTDDTGYWATGDGLDVECTDGAGTAHYFLF